MSDNLVTYFGETDFRNQRKQFGIKNKDRSRHVYVIGKTGMGKSTLLENMAAQDILNGQGMCFMDPHGSAIDVLIDYIPEHRIKDVVYFAPFDTDFPMSFNVLEHVEPDKRHLVVSGLMATFKKIWVDSFSARMEYILSNTLLALLEYPGATLLGVNRMLAEKDYRNDVIKHITDSSVKAFWIDEYNKWDPRYAREAGAAIQNKIGQFTSNPLIRNIVGQVQSTMDFRKVMDEKKILLVNLSKGLIGESNGNLLGGMLITKLYLAAMSRADVGAHKLDTLPNFFFFVDEFQNFANESFADILSEARKYKLNLTVAHQYVEQMEEQVAAAIFGNVGTMITFRIGATDAEIFEKQFAPTFTAEDIVNLGKFQIYLSLMIDGIGSRPFSARTIAPIPKQPVSKRPEVIEFSRSTYARPRNEVEKEIARWYEPIKKMEKRSFTKDGNLKSSQDSKEKTKQAEKTTKKKIIVGSKNERDFGSSPLKKTFKDIDEKNAELEMKKIVSPKLNKLLDNFESGSGNISSDKNKDVSKVIKNIHKKSTSPNSTKTSDKNTQTKKTPIPQHLAEKAASIVEKKSKRDVDSDTKNSLQAALSQALAGKSNYRKNDVAQKVKKISTTPSQEEIKKRARETRKKIAAQADKEQSRAAEQVSSIQDMPKQSSGSKTKEIPEDVLKNIFN